MKPTFVRSLKQVALVSVSGAVGFYCGCDFDKFKQSLLPMRLAGAASLPAPTQPPALVAPSAVSLQTGSRASQIMRFGYPGFDNLRTFEDFILSYDRRNRTVHWVFEHLTPDRLVYAPEVDRSKCAFTEDESIHPYFRSLNADYKGSGFDRGHIAPAGNHRRSQNAIQQTFLLSNMSPQVGKGFNRDKWNELERYARSVAKKCVNTYICSGPLYLPRAEPDGKMYVKYQVIGKQHVSVPTHFFKVILMEDQAGKLDLECFVLPNAAIDNAAPLASFHVPLESIERAAGLLLFEKLPKDKLKSVNGRGSKWF